MPTRQRRTALQFDAGAPSPLTPIELPVRGVPSRATCLEVIAARVGGTPRVAFSLPSSTPRRLLVGYLGDRSGAADTRPSAVLGPSLREALTPIVGPLLIVALDPTTGRIEGLSLAERARFRCSTAMVGGRAGLPVLHDDAAAGSAHGDGGASARTPFRVQSRAPSVHGAVPGRGAALLRQLRAGRPT